MNNLLAIGGGTGETFLTLPALAITPEPLSITDVIETDGRHYNFRPEVIDPSTGELRPAAITAWMEFIADNTKHLGKTLESKKYDKTVRQEYRGRKVAMLLNLLNRFLQFESPDTQTEKEVPKSLQQKIDLAVKLIAHTGPERVASLTEYELAWLADGCMPFRYAFIEWILEEAVDNRVAKREGNYISREIGFSTDKEQQDEQLCRLINNIKRLTSAKSAI